MTLILTFINLISSLGICLVAGAMMNMRDEIKDRIDELSMIECQIVRQLPELPEEEGEDKEGESEDGN